MFCHCHSIVGLRHKKLLSEVQEKIVFQGKINRETSGAEKCNAKLTKALFVLVPIGPGFNRKSVHIVHISIIKKHTFSLVQKEVLEEAGH